MMQFNMYHHYTVDEHLIRAVGFLSDIERGDSPTNTRSRPTIIRTIDNRRALYVAAFLHDIAKGRDEDHSEAGARIARELGRALGPDRRPRPRPSVWLVEHHLVMSDVRPEPRL